MLCLKHCPFNFCVEALVLLRVWMLRGLPQLPAQSRHQNPARLQRDFAETPRLCASRLATALLSNPGAQHASKCINEVVGR